MQLARMFLSQRSFSGLVLSIFVVGFAVNLVWENAQAPLYAGYESFWQHFVICLPYTVGDVGVIGWLYLGMAAILRDRWWVERWTLPRLVILVVMGAMVAIVMERQALAAGRWSYGPDMPIIPMLEVGVTPVLQMMVLPVVTLYLAGKARLFLTKLKGSVMMGS